ncbi:MAG: tetratricopeptide repeat protein [Planctomycetota bacterium]
MTHISQSTYRRGAVSVGWVLLLALLALAISAVISLVVTRSSEDASPERPAVSQEQIDQELGVLQQDFQTALQEKQDLSRLAAKARAFTERYPEEQGGYVLLAQTRMGLKQWDQAYTALQQALTFDENAFELSKMAGLSAAKLGRIDKALSHYLAAVQATNDQADSEVYTAIGRLYLALGSPLNAERVFNQAAEARGPGEETNYKHEAYAGLADVSAVGGDTEAALSWVDRAIKMSGIDSDADTAAYHIQKARIYMDADRDQDAVTMLNYTWSEFADTPWRIESARLRARLYERAGQLDKAVDHLQAITEWHRINENRNEETIAEFTALLAGWQIKAGRIDDARVSLFNLQALVPGHPAIDGLKEQLTVKTERTN